MEQKYDELYHYGILGMKWGIRRYQNEDGSLTEAGKKHYGSGVIGDKGRLTRAADAAEVSGKLNRLYKKKQTDKRDAKIKNLQKAYKGLLKNLDPKEIEYGQKRYKMMMETKKWSSIFSPIATVGGFLGGVPGAFIGSLIETGITSLIVGTSENTRQVNQLFKELKEENRSVQEKKMRGK